MVLWSYQAASYSELRFLPFQFAPDRLFQGFSICPIGLFNLPEIATFAKTWSSEKTKKSQPPPSLSPLPDSAGQKYHLSFSRRLLSCNSCLLFNVALEQIQQRKSSAAPWAHTLWNQGQLQPCCLADAFHELFVGRATLLGGVRRCEPWLSSCADTRS